MARQTSGPKLLTSAEERVQSAWTMSVCECMCTGSCVHACLLARARVCVCTHRGWGQQRQSRVFPPEGTPWQLCRDRRGLGLSLLPQEARGPRGQRLPWAPCTACWDEKCRPGRDTFCRMLVGDCGWLPTLPALSSQPALQVGMDPVPVRALQPRCAGNRGKNIPKAQRKGAVQVLHRHPFHADDYWSSIVTVAWAHGLL